MPTTVKIGLVVSDEGEFAPIEGYCPPDAQKVCEDWQGYRSVRLSALEDGVNLEMRVVLCGIGLANAAAATAFLIADGADYICNEGLSGALQGLARGELVVGKEFIQHDFDATGPGFDKGQVCDQPLVLTVCGDLTTRFCALHPELKTGRLVSGDEFICSKEKKNQLIDDFDALACDMESSAVAMTCLRCGVPFLVLRQAADDASDQAAQIYHEINDSLDQGVIALLFESMRALIKADRTA